MKVKLSYGKINFFKRRENNFFRSLFIYSNVKFFLVFKEITNKKKFFVLNTDKILHNKFSA